MWKVIVFEDGRQRTVYREKWMPTVDNMQVVAEVRGKPYKVFNPKGEDVTSLFHYGVET